MHEMLYEFGDVRFSFPQRRQNDGKCIEAIINTNPREIPGREPFPADRGWWLPPHGHPPASCSCCRPPRTRAPAVHAAFSADRKSTRLNSSHITISYAVFCLKK